MVKFKPSVLLKNSCLLTLVFSCVVGWQAKAQINFEPLNAVVVHPNNTDTLLNPWCGSFDSPQFNQTDVNQDGLKDLVVFERKGAAYFDDYIYNKKVFIAQQTPQGIRYNYVPDYDHLYDNHKSFMLLRDYNGDGLEDIFTYYNLGGFTVYKASVNSSNELEYSLVKRGITSQSPFGEITIYTIPSDIVSIADIDGDGDLDILSFGNGLASSIVNFYQNLSVETYGTADSLVFDLVDFCYGKFSESETSDTLELGISCKVGEKPSGLRHAGSTILSLDLNNDSKTDMLLGDVSGTSLKALINTGTNTSAEISSYSNFYPAVDSIHIPYFPAGFLIDVNQDNLNDLVVSTNEINLTSNYNNIWYYNNVGTQGQPNFQLQQTDFLVDGAIDVGSNAAPAFADVTGDGLTDLIIGNYGYFENDSIHSTLTLFQNIGSTQNPIYQLVTTNWLNSKSWQLNGVFPHFTDLNSDGALDLLVGTIEGEIHFIENTAAASQPFFAGPIQMNLLGIDVGSYAMPTTYDLTNNGLQDLLVGTKTGELQYFENQGTATTPLFKNVPTNAQLGGVKVTPFCCGGYSSPSIGSFDSSGNVFLAVGSESGWVYFYSTILGNTTNNFIKFDSLYVNGTRLKIAAADLNNDGIMELAAGHQTGGVSLLKRLGSGVINATQNGTLIQWELTIYPNPAHHEVALESNTTIQQIELYNEQGIRVYAEQNSNIQRISVANFAPGIYWLRVHSEQAIQVKKLIIVE